MSERHPPKVEDSIEVIEEGIDIFLSDEQLLKAYSPIDLTDDGIINSSS